MIGRMAERRHLTPIEIGLTAAIVAVEDDEPRILVAADAEERDPRRPAVRPVRSAVAPHLRDRPARLGRGADRAAASAMSSSSTRSATAAATRGPDDTGPHMVSVGYLALTRMPDNAAALRAAGAGFEPWYRFFPVGGLARRQRPAILDRPSAAARANGRRSAQGRAGAARSAGASGCGSASAPAARRGTRRRCSTATSCSTRRAWSRRRGATAARPRCARDKLPALGEPMRFDHRRILATAIARLRAKLKYRPVVFELMPAEFTLTELQRTVEAISGRHLHKQNFRRLVESTRRWSSRPARPRPRPAGGRPRCSASAARCCRSGPAPGLRLGGRS